MSDDADNKLGHFLTEVSNWTWDEFCRAEKDGQYTTNQAIIFALIRGCAMQKLEAIRLSLNRLDGKLKTPIKVEYPKIYYLYPHAALPEGDTTGSVAAQLLAPPQVASTPPQTTALAADGVLPPAIPDPPEADDSELPSMSLRETLTKMADYPRELPDAIVELSHQTEAWVHKRGPEPEEIPRVKSVVAANLLVMAQKRNINAITEVFDQIDGKLAETIQLLGEDIYITNYSLTAPPGATLNKDGILQIEAIQTQDAWAAKLGRQ